MEDPRDIARKIWSEAQTIRNGILGKITALENERGKSFNYTTRFENIDRTLAEFRLACMKVIFHDFEYGVKKRVEYSLWQLHSQLNNVYRSVLSRLSEQNQVVQRRKLDKLYRGFLKTSESFYRVYIQRLSARFNIPELRQAAYATELELSAAVAEDVSHSAPLRSMVLKSCQTTLVRLGDLARYRCQASDKPSKPNFEKALDYYGLANTLDSNDGTAHHQMAVLNQLEGQHLDIVYHLHRSIAIANPFQLALNNLEQEFRGLQNPSHGRRGPTKNPPEAMITWFVRLHAFFFQGKQFSQQTELEEEVLHRVEIAMKSEGTEAPLLKMILINIAAYDVATKKVQSSWTMEKSQSCQFLLRFNVRTVAALLRLLKTALEECPKTDTGAQAQEVDEECGFTFSASMMRLLPFLRIYISWIFVSRADFIQYQDYLEPYVRDVYRSLAEVLTLLTIYVDPAIGTASSKYLLTEDTEAQGLRPLSDTILPLFFIVEEEKASDSERPRMTAKPRQADFGRQFKQQTETVWRLRDIVYCGILLAKSSEFPLAFTTKSQTGSQLGTWFYTDEAPTPVASDVPSMSTVVSKLKVADFQPASEPTEPRALNVSTTSTTASSPQNRESRSFQSGSQSARGESLDQPLPARDTDPSQDSQMIDMVNKLLDPVEDARPRSSHLQEETSYGMTTSTANEIFGQFRSSPAQPSPTSKTIPSLPWAYFYTPTPHRSNSQGQNELQAHDNYVPRTASAQLGPFDSSACLQNIGAPFNQPVHGNFNAKKADADSPLGFPTGVSMASESYQYDPLGSLETSRNAVLGSLTSALYAQHGLTLGNPQTSAPFDRLPGSPLRAQTSSSGGSGSALSRGLNSPVGNTVKGAMGTSYMERSGSQRAAVGNLPSPLGAPGQGKLSTKPQGRRNGTGQSPRQVSLTDSFDAWQLYSGAPGRSGSSAEVLEHQQQHQPQLQGLPPWLQDATAAGDPSFAFSHPSSLFGGTPAQAPAPAPAPAQAQAQGRAGPAAYNGNNIFHAAGTSFGRLDGDDATRRADPTAHFRRTATGSGSAKLAHDPLRAQLWDNSGKQRPK
ncbi:hypothetical protein GGR56DRAFT_273009 [Xylariaceae sp. FL0804]|nr:hypothetical protein GGR56DRAFT_273009 [Xylariaceae sp. FL0804]